MWWGNTDCVYNWIWYLCKIGREIALNLNRISVRDWNGAASKKRFERQNGFVSLAKNWHSKILVLMVNTREIFRIYRFSHTGTVIDAWKIDSKVVNLHSKIWLQHFKCDHLIHPNPARYRSDNFQFHFPTFLRFILLWNFWSARVWDLAVLERRHLSITCIYLIRQIYSILETN